MAPAQTWRAAAVQKRAWPRGPLHGVWRAGVFIPPYVQEAAHCRHAVHGTTLLFALNEHAEQIALAVTPTHRGRHNVQGRIGCWLHPCGRSFCAGCTHGCAQRRFAASCWRRHRSCARPRRRPAAPPDARQATQQVQSDHEVDLIWVGRGGAQWPTPGSRCRAPEAGQAGFRSRVIKVKRHETITKIWEV